MPYMVVDGQKMKIDNSTCDTMSQFIQDENQTSSEEEPKRQSRWKDNGLYDAKPLDPAYFKISKQTQNPFHLSRLWHNHNKQSNFIKTQEHQKVQKLSKLMLKRCTQTSLQVLPTLHPKKLLKEMLPYNSI